MSPLCFQSCFHNSVIPEFIVVYFIWYWLVDPYHNTWLASGVSVHCTVNKRTVFRLFRSLQYLFIEIVLLGISPASNCSWPTFRNPVSVPSSKARGRLWCVRGSKVQYIPCQGCWLGLSRTSANYNLTPGKYRKEQFQYSNQAKVWCQEFLFTFCIYWYLNIIFL